MKNPQFRQRETWKEENHCLLSPEWVCHSLQGTALHKVSVPPASQPPLGHLSIRPYIISLHHLLHSFAHLPMLPSNLLGAMGIKT